MSASEQRLILDSIIRTTPVLMQEVSRDNRYDLYSRLGRKVVDVTGREVVLLGMRVEFHTPYTNIRLRSLIDDLEGLRNRPNDLMGYVFKPTKHAVRSARFYIYETYAKMGNSFPWPSFVLDGEGGVIIKWSLNGRTVRLNCLAEMDEQDYIYFENGEYDTEDNVTPSSLRNRLNWLTQNEREPAR